MCITTPMNSPKGNRTRKRTLAFAKKPPALSPSIAMEFKFIDPTFPPSFRSPEGELR
jgi:hypothetical protein